MKCGDLRSFYLLAKQPFISERQDLHWFVTYHLSLSVANSKLKIYAQVEEYQISEIKQQHFGRKWEVIEYRVHNSSIENARGFEG